MITALDCAFLPTRSCSASRKIMSRRNQVPGIASASKMGEHRLRGVGSCRANSATGRKSRKIEKMASKLARRGCIGGLPRLGKGRRWGRRHSHDASARLLRELILILPDYHVRSSLRFPKQALSSVLMCYGYLPQIEAVSSSELILVLLHIVSFLRYSGVFGDSITATDTTVGLRIAWLPSPKSNPVVAHLIATRVS